MLNPLCWLVFSAGAPPLPPPAGRVVEVRTVAALRGAIEGAADGDTIAIADGTYRLDRLLYLHHKNHITLRGASGDPSKVILRGRGFDTVDPQDDILRIGTCDGVTVADLTFEDCHAYGLKVEGENAPRNIRIQHCRFRNIGTRAIKGSARADSRVIGGSIRYCDFANTKVPPAEWQFGGNYISAIDLMCLEGWHIADNVFRDIKGAGGSARAAIFLWVRSRDVTVERNLILHCDRGIAFGNPSAATSTGDAATELHMQSAICRNNAIVAGPDAGIELAWVDGVKVLNNTIWRAEGRGRGIRCITRISNTELVNNLVRGEILLTDGVTARANLAGPLDGCFVDPAAGDLRLRPTATEAIGRGERLPEVDEDFAERRRKDPPDLGAFELDRP